MKEEYDRAAIIAAHPILDYCRARGWELRRAGREWQMLCPLHEERTPSFSVNPDKQVFYCHGCGAGGSVIDLHAAVRRITTGEAMRELHPPPGEPPPREVASYEYEDVTGRVRYQVVRYAPKTFKQCRLVDGERVWNMDGVERLPYRLPELLGNALSVWIVEGEKDVETLRAGQTATCNPGGVGKWLPAFSQYLRDKCVYLCPDRDEVGEKHAGDVLKSLAGIVKWVKWVELPPEYNGAPVKDVSDLRAACASRAGFCGILEHLKAKARLIERGIDSDAYTMAELEQQYIAEKTAFGDVCLNLNRWLPALDLRPLGPGDLAGIMANTGQCKTAAVQNILACNPGLPGILFELELSGPQMFERAAAISTGINAWKISQDYDEGFVVDWCTPGKFKNLLVCTASLNMAEIDARIGRASAKLGCCPRIFVIDYAQLVRGPGTRYERMSETCEEAKRLAKKWNAIGIIISQVARPEDRDNCDSEVGIYDAKESGSFENSCGLVLGVWKTAKTELACRVLKNTRGFAGKKVAMRLRDNTYIIEPAL